MTQSLYQAVRTLIIEVREQLEENLIVRVDNEFEETITETDYIKRAKLEKQRRRELAEIDPISSEMYPLQIRMIQLQTNLSFLLENAHNKVSYPALARYFSEYDFLAKRITKIAKKSKHPALQDFLKRTTVLTENFFSIMNLTLGDMRDHILKRMRQHPEQYIDLNPETDAHIDMDVVKAAFKARTDELKKEFSGTNA